MALEPLLFYGAVCVSMMTTVKIEDSDYQSIILASCWCSNQKATRGWVVEQERKIETQKDRLSRVQFIIW